jgi:hypothetical protein
MANSNFSNTKSVASFKEEHGNAMQIIKNPNNGNIFFTCGDGCIGYISKPVQEKILNKKPLGTLMVSHVKSDDGFDGYMLHSQSTENVMMDL